VRRTAEPLTDAEKLAADPLLYMRGGATAAAEQHDRSRRAAAATAGAAATAIGAGIGSGSVTGSPSGEFAVLMCCRVCLTCTSAMQLCAVTH
jgi:hypothetical protein